LDSISEADYLLKTAKDIYDDLAARPKRELIKCIDMHESSEH